MTEEEREGEKLLLGERMENELREEEKKECARKQRRGREKKKWRERKDEGVRRGRKEGCLFWEHHPLSFHSLLLPLSLLSSSVP